MGTKTIEDSAMIKVKSSTFIAIQKWYKSMEYGLDKDHVSTTNVTVINDSSMRRKWSDLLPTTNEYTRREDRQLQITAPAVIRKVQNKQY